MRKAFVTSLLAAVVASGVQGMTEERLEQKVTEAVRSCTPFESMLRSITGIDTASKEVFLSKEFEDMFDRVKEALEALRPEIEQLIEQRRLQEKKEHRRREAAGVGGKGRRISALWYSEMDEIWPDEDYPADEQLRRKRIRRRLERKHKTRRN